MRSHYKNGFIKQYVRDNRVLRTEAATNNVNDYGVHKGMDNLPALRQTLQGITDRYLDVQQDILESFIDRDQLREAQRTHGLTQWQKDPGPEAGPSSATGADARARPLLSYRRR